MFPISVNYVGCHIERAKERIEYYSFHAFIGLDQIIWYTNTIIIIIAAVVVGAAYLFVIPFEDSIVSGFVLYCIFSMSFDTSDSYIIQYNMEAFDFQLHAANQMRFHNIIRTKK